MRLHNTHPRHFHYSRAGGQDMTKHNRKRIAELNKELKENQGITPPSPNFINFRSLDISEEPNKRWALE